MKKKLLDKIIAKAEKDFHEEWAALTLDLFKRSLQDLAPFEDGKKYSNKEIIREVVNYILENRLETVKIILSVHFANTIPAKDFADIVKDIGFSENK